MKIAIASDLYWPMINGISVFTKNLAEKMSARGHEVVVFAPSQNGDFYVEEADGFRVVRLTSYNFPFYPSQTKPLDPPKTLAGGKIKVPRLYLNDGYRFCLAPYGEIKKFCKSYDFMPDVVHIQLQLMVGQNMINFARKNHIPIVSTNHSSPENLFDNLKLLAPFSPVINRATILYTKRFNIQADYATMPTRLAIERFFGEKHNQKMPIEAVSNGIDLSRFTPEKPSKYFFEKFGLDPKRPIVMNIGRVDAEKHISTLILAFNEVLQKVKDAQLVIVGDGTDRVNLENLVYQLGIHDHVHFMGTQLGDDLVEFHRAADVFVSASPTETQGIVYLEAAACGKPVIGVDVGAVKEICQDGVNGFLCETDNVEQIADSIHKILSDKVLREEFSKNSLQIIKKHDLNYTIEKFEEIYNFVIEKKKKEPRGFRAKISAKFNKK
ncbi:MAG: glycosyltransferase [bacterium]|nr:glycosyltransferase [bacterium]